MQIPKPTSILTAGVSVTGKTEFLDRFCSTTPNTLLLDKDSLNYASFHVRPTYQGQLPSIKDTLKCYQEKAQLTNSVFYNGEPMLRVAFPTEFLGRHVRDPNYVSFEQLTRDNLRIGKSPVIQAIVYRQVHDRTLPGFMAKFRDYPTALLHFVVDEDIRRKRSIERAEKDAYARERDLPKLKDDKAWKEYVESQPAYWHNLINFYNCCVIDTSNREGKPLEQSVQECIEQAEAYILERTNKRDELLYSVNEKGEVLGGVHYTKAHSRDAKEAIRHLAANVFIFKNQDRKQLLLQKRGESTYKAGVWGVPGGQVLYEAPSNGDLETALQNLGIKNILEINGNQKEAEEKIKQITNKVLELSDKRAPYDSIKRETSEEVFNNQPLPQGIEFREVYRSPKQTKHWDSELEIMFEAFYPGPFQLGEESAELRFFDIQELKKDIKPNPEKYANSLKIQLEKFPFN